MCVTEILLFCPSSDYNMMKNIYDGLTYTIQVKGKNVVGVYIWNHFILHSKSRTDVRQIKHQVS